MNDLLPSGRGRRLALVAGGGILATALVVALIAQASHSAHLLDRLRHATPGWLVVCAAGEVIAYAGYLAGYRAMAQLDGGPRLPAGVALRVVALAFGAFALATAVGGLSVDFWALREAGEPPARASARVIAFETLRWAVLAIATWLAALAALLGLSRSVGPVLPVAWLVVVPACFAGGLWVSAARRRGRLDSSGARGHSWVRRALAVAVDALVYLRMLVSARWGGLRGARSAAASSSGPATCCARGQHSGRSAPELGSVRCCSAMPPATCPRPCPSPPVAPAASMPQ